jgi:hypothetical protein
MNFTNSFLKTYPALRGVKMKKQEYLEFLIACELIREELFKRGCQPLPGSLDLCETLFDRFKTARGNGRARRKP